MSLVSLSLLVGCNQTVVGSTQVGTVPQTTTSATTGVRPLASGVEITKISVWQGVESVIWEDGSVPSTLEMPIITNRDALVRVFLDPDADFDGRKVTGILTLRLAEGDVVLEKSRKIEEKSKDAELDTTLNFYVEAEHVKKSLDFSLEIVEETPDGPGGGDEAKVTWASEEHGGLDTQATDDLTLVIVPVRYNADGSGRLPDTSESQIQRIEDLVRGTYPAAEVTIRVDPPLDWDRTINPWDGNDWSDLLDEIGDMRDDANEAPNTYYYGMFNATDSVNSFCASGCILGLSLLAFTANDPYFRASVGVGFPGDISSETLVHEVGHAHGREHAPCGLGNQSSDRNYPYSGAKLGSWGYDPVNDMVLDPDTYVDMMSYCAPLWVSDYTFYSLMERIQSVSGQVRSAVSRRTAVSVDADGQSEMRGPMNLAATSSGPRVDVQLFDAAGAPAGRVQGSFFPYSHIAGGLVALDEELPEGFTAEVLAVP